MPGVLERYPSLRYVLPFAVFMVWLGVGPALPVSPRVEAVIRVTVLLAVIALVARPVLSFRLERPVATVLVGVGVFVLWILPDQLIPGYRESVLFQNGITGRVESSVAVESRTDLFVISLRFLRAALIVPIVEELFWRGWLPRWIDASDDFRRRPLGSFTTFSFVATVILFGMEHGPFWDVGIAAGIVYNWWMIKTRSLGDLIWCHAVTNACLSGWVVVAGHWQYW